MKVNHKPNHEREVAQDALAEKMADRLLSLQMGVANYLNRKTAHFSKVQKEILLLCFSLIFSLISLYLIFKAFI